MVHQPCNPNFKKFTFACAAVAILLIFQIAALLYPHESLEVETVTAKNNNEGFRRPAGEFEAVETASEAGAETKTGGYRSFLTYRVQPGDSLYWIAGSYGISIQELQRLNNLESDRLAVGQCLVVPLDNLKRYPAGVCLSNTEVEWLAQMIHAEARGEPYLGQVAVGAVIINRMLSPQFPDTLREVLFQPNAFQPIRNGSFYLTPNESARRAALEALSGIDPTAGALYFFNPRQSTDRFMHSRPTQATIGRHRFTN